MSEIITFEQLPSAVTQLSKKLDNIEKFLIQKFDQQPNQVPEQLLTIQQAAEFLSLAVPTIYSKVSRGELPVMKRSKRLYFSSIELLQYLKAGRRKTLAEITSEADQYLIKKRKG